MRGNTIEIVLSHGRIGQTRGLFQYDRGQKLLIKGEVPGVYAVHFSNQELGTSKTTIAQGNLALIPDEYLQSGEDIHLWVVVTGEDHSETEYHGVINVIPRAQPSDLEPEWEEASIIEQAIEALNTATAATASAMSTIEDTVHSVVQEAIDSGEFDGFTPTITIEQQGEDTTITVVGKDDTQSATIHQNDPLSIIDDTAGNGVTDKVWSADKTHDQLDAKAPKLAPNFTGSVSMNRADGYSVGAGSTALGMQVAASGENSFAEGYNTVASKPNQHVGGKFNVEDTQSGGKYAEIVGNGTAANRRSNARALDWQGNEYLAGDVYVNCGSNSTGGEKLQTAGEVSAMITDAIRDISSFDVQIVEELPSDKNSHTIYFVPSEDSDLGNLYKEYMWINNKWEMVGGTGFEVDISGKADKTDTVLDTTLSRGRSASSTVGQGSFAFGDAVVASGGYSHAEGQSTEANGNYSHTEGNATKATGSCDHSEGQYTRATGGASHAEGFGIGDSQIQYYKMYARTDTGHEGELDVQRISASAGANGYASHSEGYQTAANGSYTHAEGYMAYAVGNFGHAEGEYTYANTNAHAEGYQTSAVGNNAHSEGHNTLAEGNSSHTEGDGTFAFGSASHAEGNATKATGTGAHAEGELTRASGGDSHAEGYKTVAAQTDAHAEGAETTANGYAAHTEGYKTVASYAQAHAEGQETVASHVNAHAEGYKTGARGDNSHAEGEETYAAVKGAHAEGYKTTAAGPYAHAEGSNTYAVNSNAHAEGGGTTASGQNAHAEGSGTIATASYSHAEGGGTHATGTGSHAEGASTYANGDLSHAEGNSTHANGPLSHAEGEYTVANGAVSHVSGRYNVPDDYTNWPEWAANTDYAVGDKVKRTTTQNNETVGKGYICGTANSDSSFDSSKWVEDSYINYAVIVGNGKYNDPSNAYSLDWDGNGHFKGDVYVGCNADGTGGTKLRAITFASDEDIQAIIDDWEVSA